jgi:hypothetical protein
MHPDEAHFSAAYLPDHVRRRLERMRRRAQALRHGPIGAGQSLPAYYQQVGSSNGVATTK